MEMILNKKSGWSALTGTTDFGKIVASDSKECKLAHDVFVDRILNFVGSYYLKMEGNVDAIVFAGGLGEKASSVRKAVLDKCRCFGFRLDEERNKSDLEDVVEDIGAKDSQQRILVCQTDEQFEMARSCVMDSGMFSMH
jgi:acetate kinase